MFLSLEINSEVIEATVRNCSLKKFLSKILKNSQENTSVGVSFSKNKTKREKKKLYHRCFIVNYANFFQNPSFEGC